MKNNLIRRVVVPLAAALATLVSNAPAADAKQDQKSLSLQWVQDAKSKNDKELAAAKQARDAAFAKINRNQPDAIKEKLDKDAEAGAKYGKEKLPETIVNVDPSETDTLKGVGGAAKHEIATVKDYVELRDKQWELANPDSPANKDARSKDARYNELKAKDKMLSDWEKKLIENSNKKPESQTPIRTPNSVTPKTVAPSSVPSRPAIPARDYNGGRTLDIQKSHELPADNKNWSPNRRDS